MSDVSIARDGAVARVTLDRPQLHNDFLDFAVAGGIVPVLDFEPRL